MPKLKVAKLTPNYRGREIAQIHVDHRNGVNRWGVAKLTSKNTGKSVTLVILGHDEKEKIFLDYDTRNALGVKLCETYDFGVEKSGFCDRLLWYISSRDPAVHIPAWLALISICLGFVGLLANFL